MNHELCPKVEATLSLLGKKWNALIIYVLREGDMKFTDIQKLIPGLSARLLDDRLKYLVKEGILNKNIDTKDQIKISYSLTRKGIDLSESFKALEAWAEKWN